MKCGLLLAICVLALCAGASAQASFDLAAAAGPAVAAPAPMTTSMTTGDDDDEDDGEYDSDDVLVDGLLPTTLMSDADADSQLILELIQHEGYEIDQTEMDTVDDTLSEEEIELASEVRTRALCVCRVRLRLGVCLSVCANEWTRPTTG
jgi:hypothetical protein